MDNMTIEEVEKRILEETSFLAGYLSAGPIFIGQVLHSARILAQLDKVLLPSHHFYHGDNPRSKYELEQLP